MAKKIIRFDGSQKTITKYHIRVLKNGNLYAPPMGELFSKDFLVRVRYVAVGDLLVLNEQGFIVDVVPSYAVKKE